MLVSVVIGAPLIVIVFAICSIRRRVLAKEQSDNDVRTSLVYDQREGKRKVMINKIVLTVYGIETPLDRYGYTLLLGVATVLTVYGIETGIR